jgi:hypothetical protein
VGGSHRCDGFAHLGWHCYDREYPSITEQQQRPSNAYNGSFPIGWNRRAIDMNDGLTLGCILLFDADRHLLAQLPITPLSGDAVAEQSQVDVPGVPRFATVINADGDVIGGGPIDHKVRIPREFAQELIRRLAAA